MPAGTSPYKKDYLKVTTATGNRSFAAKASVQIQGYLKGVEAGAIDSDGQIPGFPAPSSPHDMNSIKFGSQYEKTP